MEPLGIVCTLFFDLLFRLRVLSQLFHHQTTVAEAELDGSLHQDECNALHSTLHRFQQWFEEHLESGPSSIQPDLVTITLDNARTKLCRLQQHIFLLQSKKNRRKHRLFPSRSVQAQGNVSAKLEDIKKDVDLIKSYIDDWSSINSTHCNSFIGGEHTTETQSWRHNVHSSVQPQPEPMCPTTWQPHQSSLPYSSHGEEALSKCSVKSANAEATCTRTICETCAQRTSQQAQSSAEPVTMIIEDWRRNGFSACCLAAQCAGYYVHFGNRRPLGDDRVERKEGERGEGLNNVENLKGDNCKGIEKEECRRERYEKGRTSEICEETLGFICEQCAQQCQFCPVIPHCTWNINNLKSRLVRFMPRHVRHDCATEQQGNVKI